LDAIVANGRGFIEIKRIKTPSLDAKKPFVAEGLLI
jgi:hypothetical protein